MNQVKEFSFKSLNQDFMEEECNVWEDDLSEESMKNEIIRKSSLQQNMETNSFSKYEKSYVENNLMRFSTQNNYKESRLSDNMSSLMNGIWSEDDAERCQRIFLKDEVSLLLKALINSKKFQNDTELVSQISSNNHNRLKLENIKENEELVTMRQIKPINEINWF